MNSRVRTYGEMATDGSTVPPGWGLRAIVNDDNLAYLVFHEGTKEAIVVDPVREDWETLVAETARLGGYRFIAVIDTHTHADHVSNADRLAAHLGAPLVMSRYSRCSRVTRRIEGDSEWETQAGPLRFYETPGHTPDGLTIFWGPFLFGGDTFMYGDTGRDDMPGGDPSAHFESLQKIKAVARPENLFLPNHDGKGGRVSTWATQLRENPSLTQDRETFVREASAFTAPMPKNFKESIVENTR